MAAPYRLRATQSARGSTADKLLGPRVRSYYAAAHRASIVAMAPFVLLLAYVVWLQHRGELLRWFNSTFSAGAVSIIFVLAIALIAYSSAVGGGELVRVHEGGLFDLRAGPRSVRWDEIESLTAEVDERGHLVRHILRTTDGAALSLGRSIAEVADLIEHVRVHMSEHDLPALRARIDAGETVRFGALSASGAGLALGLRVVAWSEVTDIEAEGGEIVVRGASGERLGAARVEDVPNAFLLAEIAREKRKA